MIEPIHVIVLDEAADDIDQADRFIHQYHSEDEVSCVPYQSNILR